ncbi:MULTISPECIES: NUDIX hydrolase [Mesonia]|uniref:Diadenosine hexaphosphate hydrolase n=1 Tax=Mesonia oceanica TaxID=2687242 RepID=A0AC61YAU0_9FLAO|nr:MULTISPECIES: NUDIX domain-containing protein [Mesonia]MAN29367.1 NUDIX hydrolase [Mesonia sp.]MAQ41602.1 NUDIX hydrolase [Mesonia sp.]VVV01440.1 Diadenosine hexaphosphate hydrolase [Mesonia oceanica]|tara:strand:- start:8149 stop:8772 length:624 start_codon:yes stop_codon:yes gene_type:complete
MYKVFVKDIPIILSTKKEIGDKYTSIPIKKVKLKKLIKKILKGEILYVNLYHKDEKKLFKHLRSKLKPIVAGGGLVYNPKGEILFIYRNDKWDLPKGKAEKNETIEETSIREVEEETKVEGLQITEFLQTTYHVMKRKGKFRLKETHWFEMKTDFDGELTPQENEGITKVEWKNFEKTQEALKESYENIKLLFPKEYLIQHPENRIS